MLITLYNKEFEFMSDYQDASSPAVDVVISRPLGPLVSVPPAVAYAPTVKSMRDKATPGVELLGPKSLQARPRQKRADPIAKFSEATRVDQEQTQREGDQHHEEKMAKISARRQKDEMKHAHKLAELEIRKAELVLHSSGLAYSPPQHTLGLDFRNGLLTLELRATSYSSPVA